MATSVAFAGPPFQTDDPEPVAVGAHELYIALAQTRTADGVAGSQPLVELNYGAMDDLQIGIGMPYAFDNPQPGSAEHGIGDIALSAKYRFLQETGNRPMVSFFPLIELPTGNAERGLGNDKTQIFLPIWLQKNWDEWQSNSGGGYWINHAAKTKEATGSLAGSCRGNYRNNGSSVARIFIRHRRSAGGRRQLWLQRGRQLCLR